MSSAVATAHQVCFLGFIKVSGLHVCHLQLQQHVRYAF